MKKIFTDADIWDKEWFLDLPIKLKILWKYLTDNCDQAGVWEVNYRLASFSIGEKISHEDVLSFGDRIVFIDDKKALIVGRVNFQCGILNEYCNAHKPVLKALSRHGLKQDSVSGDVFKEIKEPFGNPSELVPNPSGVVRSHLGSLQEEEKEKEEEEEKEKEQDKEIEKEKEKEKEREQTRIQSQSSFKPRLEPQKVIDLYNRKFGGVGKMERCNFGSMPPAHLENFFILIGFPEFSTMEKIESYFDKYLESNYLTHKRPKSILWMINPNNAFRVLAGEFRDFGEAQEPEEDNGNPHRKQGAA